MDFKDPKIQKIALAGVVFFILVYFWYSHVYTQQASEIKTKQGEYQTMITNLRNVEMKSKSLDALQTEYQDLLTRYREIEQLLPEVKMVPSFLVQLHTASSLTGTRITSIKPKPVSPQTFYNVADFEVEMTGTYHDFGKFVSYIANFPFIVNVSEMEINSVLTSAGAATASGNDEGKQNTITARFTLSTYFVKANERLEEIEI